MLRAGARLATWLDLGAVRKVAAETIDLLVVDVSLLIAAERADAATSPCAELVITLLESLWCLRHGVLLSIRCCWD